MEDAITNKADPYRNMDKTARSLFKGTEPVRITYSFPNGIKSGADLKEIESMHEKLKDSFPEAVVYSLANAPYYHSVGEDLRTPKYTDVVAPAFQTEGKFNLTAWKEVLMKNEVAAGKLIERDLSIASFYVFPDSSQAETEVFREVVEYLEGDKCGALCIFFKNDIKPQNPRMGVAGWIVGRGLVNGGLHYDIIRLVFLGVMTSCLAFFLFTRSFRQALIGALVVVGVGVFATRGSIGLLTMVGVDIKESVFMLLAYVAVIVQGTSFPLRLFATYNALRREGMDGVIAWKQARKRMLPAMLFITILAVIGFGTLFTFSVSSIREMGIVAGIGAINAFLLAGFVAPALYRLCGKDAIAITKESGFQRWCTAVAVYITASVQRTPLRVRAPVVGGGIVVIAIVAVATAFYGWLIIGTKPLELTKGTIVDRTATVLNAPGKSGFDAVQFFITPSRAEVNLPATRNLAFMQEVKAFMQEVKSFSGVREVSGITQAVEVVWHDYGSTFPATEQDLARVMLDVGAVEQYLRQQLYNNAGFRMAVFTSADSSRGLGQLIKDVVTLSKSYPEMRALPFGALSQYPWVDDYIVYGKPLNVATSQGVVILLYVFWLWWRFGRRMRAEGLSGSWRLCIVGGVVMSVPLFFASAMIILWMEVTGTPLDIATACIGALAINAAGDFSVHMAEVYYRRVVHGGESHEVALRATAKENGGEVVADALLNMINFSPLLFSVFPPIVRLGGVMVAMLLFAAIGVLVCMSALLHQTLPKDRRL